MAGAVDPVDVNHLLIENQNLSLRRATDGATFAAAISGITETSSTFPFRAYLAADPNDGRRAFLGGKKNLWRTLDHAVSWTAAAPVEANGAVSAVEVSPFDSNVVFFGTLQGFICRSNSALSADGATPWKSARPRAANVTSIAFDPTNPNIMYAAYSNLKSAAEQAHVYRSTDAGQTWSPADGSGSTAVPDLPVWRILVDPYSPSTLYLATDLGVLVSTDSGATWSHDAGLPNVIVEDLSFEATNSWIFAYTFGRGAYKTPLPGAPPLDYCAYSVDQSAINSDAFGGTVPVTVSAPAGCRWVAFPIAPAFAGIQSPAQGSGSGTAFVTVPPNLTTTPSKGNLTIAGAPIAASQDAAVFRNISNDSVEKAPVISVPSMFRMDIRAYTTNAEGVTHTRIQFQFADSSVAFPSAFSLMSAPPPNHVRSKRWSCCSSCCGCL
jgi:hypothetical protein